MPFHNVPPSDGGRVSEISSAHNNALLRGRQQNFQSPPLITDLPTIEANDGTPNVKLKKSLSFSGKKTCGKQQKRTDLHVLVEVQSILRLPQAITSGAKQKREDWNSQLKAEYDVLW